MISLFYTFTLGFPIGWLQSTICISPYWKWYGPIPVYRRFDRWDKTN